MAKTLKDVPIITSITSQRLVTTNSSGVINSIAPENLDVYKYAFEGILIMYHSANDNIPLLSNIADWPALQNSGEIADGVAVRVGTRILVVSPTEIMLRWSSANVTGGGYSTTNRAEAITDMAGKSNSAAQITHSECSDANYAPGYCAAYSRTNKNGYGLTAGKWWLPSLGELLCLNFDFRKINYALSQISGATKLNEGSYYWASTEAGSAYAWGIIMRSRKIAKEPGKISYSGRVRPVSEFIE